MPDLELSALENPVAPTPASPAIRTDRTFVRRLLLEEIDTAFERRWKDLARRSLTPNPFLEPEFVLPALEHLPDLARPVFLAVEGDRGALVGLGIFEEVSGSRRLPIPHLRSWQTPHTYLDGLLLDRRIPELAVSSLWKYLVNDSHAWHGVEFPRLREGDELDAALTFISEQAEVEWVDGRSIVRAQLETDWSPEVQQAAISPKRAKSLRRGWHELERRGATAFHVERHDQTTVAGPVTDFLRLESLGWKADEGTAMECCAEQRAFFVSMMDRFAASGRTLFTTVTVDGATVGTVAHLISGAGAFAFKLGWDPAFERGCPGFQLKAHLAEHADELLPEIRWVDSCSSEGSFIEHLWGGRTTVRSRLFLTSRAASVAAMFVDKVKSIRDVLLGRSSS